MLKSYIEPTMIFFKEPVELCNISLKDWRCNKYKTNRQLKIPFETGSINLEKVMKTLQTNLEYCKKFYAQGELKKSFIQDILYDR